MKAMDKSMVAGVFKAIPAADLADRGHDAAHFLRRRLAMLKNAVATYGPLDESLKEEVAGVLAELGRDFENRREWQQCIASGRDDCGECPGGGCPIAKDDAEDGGGDELVDDAGLGADLQGDGGDDDLAGPDLSDDDVFDIAAISHARKQGDTAAPEDILSRYRSPDGSPADDRDAARAEIIDRYHQQTQAEQPRRLPWQRGR
jgi:hypothetical protein